MLLNLCFGRMVKAEAKIAKDPYEVDSWTTLVMEALLRDVLTAREVFEAFFERFPTAVSLYRCYYFSLGSS